MSLRPLPTRKRQGSQKCCGRDNRDAPPWARRKVARIACDDRRGVPRDGGRKEVVIVGIGADTREISGIHVNRVCAGELEVLEDRQHVDHGQCQLWTGQDVLVLAEDLRADDRRERSAQREVDNPRGRSGGIR